jgi:arylsulfatase A-like enzyme
MGWNNVGWHNGSLSLTPHLDKLAAGGVRLTQHYTQRWCAPTRTAVMTGRYPYNTGMMQYGHGLAEELSAVPAAFSFLPAMLKQHAPAPYRTAHLGKWHLGFFTKAHVPAGRGFDSSFGFMLGQSSHDNRSSQVSHTCGVPVKDLYNGSRIANDTSYAYDNLYDERMYAAQARDLILAHGQAAAGVPLYLYMAFQNCHAPYQAPQEYLDRYPTLPAGESQRCYNAMVAALDDTVGAIVAALEEAGMSDNTVIIFTSDNGGPAQEANNMPLRWVHGCAAPRAPHTAGAPPRR